MNPFNRNREVQRLHCYFGLFQLYNFKLVQSVRRKMIWDQKFLYYNRRKFFNFISFSRLAASLLRSNFDDGHIQIAG